MTVHEPGQSLAIADYSAMRDLTPTEFAAFQKFLRDSCGILLGDNKQYLLKSRLSGLVKAAGYHGLGDLVAALRHDIVTPELKSRIIDAMTTNETFWFRERVHFEELSGVLLPKWIAARMGGVSIWSAACSTGQEPYSLSICVEDALRSQPGPKPVVRILGTDISTSALTEATRAVYGDLALSRGLDSALKTRYFLPDKDDSWRIKPEIAARVRFQAFNLLSPYTALGRFDAIFCRNVLIYFPDEIKRDVLTRMAGALKPGGYLFLGSVENLPAGVDAYETVRGGRCLYYRVKTGMTETSLSGNGR